MSAVAVAVPIIGNRATGLAARLLAPRAGSVLAAAPTVHWRLEATLQLKLLTTLHVTPTGESLPHSAAGGTLLHCSLQMSMCVSYRYLLAEKTGNEGIHLSSLNINTYLGFSVQYCKGALLQDY